MGKTPALLGDLGRFLPDDEQLDLSISRLGGSPAWLRQLGHPPAAIACGVCGQPSVFVGQLDATYEALRCRALHIFSCLNPSCGADDRAWRALRSVAPWPKVAAPEAQEVIMPEDSGGDALSLGAAQWLGISAHPCAPGVRGVVPLVSLPCFALDIYDEPPPLPKSGASELQLFERYRNSEFAAEDLAAAEVLASAGGGGDAAEGARDGAVHSPEVDVESCSGDEWFMKFQRRLERSPAQVVRYSWGASPLWISDPPEEVENNAWPPPCGLCGAPRVFEMQLMPTLLYELRRRCPEQVGDADIEWGTVLVYTCAGDCAVTEPAREFVVVQPAV
mmetsp:Transcript_41592/g.114630  ORF Transcript_41592/g.114630 Transcript_41592/m.114630 type:complete len:333 (-) Transcript_41592:258-1256(-)